MNQLQNQNESNQNTSDGLKFLTSFLGPTIMAAHWTHHGAIDWTDIQKAVGFLPTDEGELILFILEVARYQEKHGFGQIELMLMLDILTRGLKHRIAFVREVYQNQAFRILNHEGFQLLEQATQDRIRRIFAEKLQLVQLALNGSGEPSARSHGIELLHLQFREI